METEIWKDIPGYEGLYQVSNFGTIKSMKRMVKHSLNSNRICKEKIILPKLSNTGYYRVHLNKNGIQKKLLIHRIIAIAFIQNPLNKPCVNHIDGNPTNNNILNLEWCTYSENEIHSYVVLGKKSPRLNVPRSINKNSRKVIQYTKTGLFISEYNSIIDASETLNIDNSLISKVCRGYRNQTGGFIWKYK